MASVISTTFLPDNPKDFRNTIKLLLKEKQAGNNSDLIKEETVAIADKLLENKNISTKKHNFMIIKWLN